MLENAFKKAIYGWYCTYVEKKIQTLREYVIKILYFIFTGLEFKGGPGNSEFQCRISN